MGIPPWRQTHDVVSAPNVPVAVVLILVYLALQAVVGNATMALVGELGLSSPNMADMRVGVVVTSIVITTAVLLAFIRVCWPAWWHAGAAGPGWTTTRWFWCLLAIIIGVAVAFAGSVLMYLLAPHQPMRQGISTLALQAGAAWQIALGVVLVSCVPVIEELLFRGVLLEALQRRWSPAVAVMTSALLFALAHWLDRGMSWPAVGVLFVLGCLLGWLRVASGALWPSIVAHAANNVVAAIGWVALSMGL